MFENAADYLHVFSCNPKDGEQWMSAVLVARVSKPNLFRLNCDAHLLLVVRSLPGAQRALCQKWGFTFPS